MLKSELLVIKRKIKWQVTMKHILYNKKLNLYDYKVFIKLSEYSKKKKYITSNFAFWKEETWMLCAFETLKHH